MVNRWKCPKCGTRVCMCRKTCPLCGTKRPKHPEMVEVQPHSKV